MTRAPRVSILLPVRDAAATLAECLASLAAQSLADHELLAVDDASSDGSRALLEAAARRDPRVRVLSSSGGLVAALNRSLAEARAPLLARMDADDVADPERLQLQAERLEADRDTDILGSRVRLFGMPPGHNDGMRAYVDWQNALLEHAAIVLDLLVEAPLVHPSVMMRSAALRRLGGYRDFAGPEDYDLWLRAHAAGLRFAKSPEVLLAWRDGPQRLTRRDARYAPECFRALKLARLLRGPLGGGRAVVLWGAGEVGKAWARALLARGVRVAGFVEVDPRKIGRRVYAAPVVGLSDAAGLVGPLHLAAVGQRGARERIRAEAARLGLVEGRDLLAVA